eukprot:2651953-Alexandrium_andersonii.AAC.1
MLMLIERLCAGGRAFTSQCAGVAGFYATRTARRQRRCEVSRSRAREGQGSACNGMAQADRITQCNFSDAVRLRPSCWK